MAYQVREFTDGRWFRVWSYDNYLDAQAHAIWCIGRTQIREWTGARWSVVR